MRTISTAFSFFMVGALACIALLSPTTVNAQTEESGTVNISVHHCLGLEAPGPLPEAGENCIPGPASFDFYLYNDGTDDHDTVTVGDDGLTSVDLPVGEYSVHETNTDTSVGDVVVSADVPLNISWGIPRVEAPPEDTALLQVYTFACEDLLGEPIVLGEIGPDCTQISQDLTFYLWGDGTDDHWILRTAESGLSLIELPVGDYDVVDSASNSTVGVRVPDGTSAVAIGYPVVGAPEPEPELATLGVTTYACEGIEGDPIVLSEIGPDCTQVSTNLSFYLWGDGTDDFWPLTTSDTDVATVDLPAGGYDVVNEATQETVGVQVPEGNSSVAFGFAVAAAPDPEPELATLNVTTYVCDGIEGDPVVLGEIGPDCTQVSSNLSFYLWGDGTDDFWPLTTSETGVATVDLPAGGYDVVNEATQQTVGVQVPEGNSSVAFGFPTTPPVETSLIIKINLPNNGNIEGAPYGIYAPVAAQQFMAEPYVEGVVGANNTIQVDGLIPGMYGVVVAPADMAAIDFTVEVGSGVTEALATVDSDGNVTVTYGFQDPPPADQPPAETPVTKLPETGVGTENSLNAVGVLVSGAILAAGALGLRVRHSNI